jgi:hypothetical protein
MQVALKLLKCWQGVVVNSQDYVKPYIHGLLPPVVSGVSMFVDQHMGCVPAAVPHH